MYRIKPICILLSILILLSSCGSTYIVTDKGNDIYMNGQKLGTEKVEIERNGLPKKALIEIKQGNEVVNTQSLKRKFTIKTFAWTLFYGTGLLFAWQYPETTYIEGKPEKKKNGQSIWAQPPKQKSIWQ